MAMFLKPQDILFLLKLVSIGKNPWSYNKLAVALGMSPAEVHAAARRAVTARLAVREQGSIRPVVRNLEELLVHGLRYVFPPGRGSMARGVPTLSAAPPLVAEMADSPELPYVWPDPEGAVRGLAFSPLYRSAPVAARADERLYELLVLVDAIRGGQIRERRLAVKELKKRLERYAEARQPESAGP